MKKRIRIFLLITMAVSIVFSGCGIFANRKNRLKEDASAEQVVTFYSEAVKNSKNSGNFKLDVKTTVELNTVNSGVTLLDNALVAIMGYKVGDSVKSSKSFSFENGRDSENHTPMSVIQPAGAFIENFNENAITVKSISNDENTRFSFVIKKESAQLDAVTKAIIPIIKGQENADKSAVVHLAPNHSVYIDVGDILSTVIDILGIENMINGSGSEKASSSNTTIGIDGGKCSLGETEFTVETDENNLLKSVSFSAPVELNANIKFMNNIFSTVIGITVSQVYTFEDYV